MKPMNHPLKAMLASQPKTQAGPKRPLTVMGNEVGEAGVGQPIELCVYATVVEKMKDGSVLLDITEVEPSEENGDSTKKEKAPVVRLATEPAP